MCKDFLMTPGCFPQLLTRAALLPTLDAAAADPLCDPLPAPLAPLPPLPPSAAYIMLPVLLGARAEAPQKDLRIFAGEGATNMKRRNQVMPI